MFYHMSQFTFDEFNFMWLSYEIASIRWTCDAVTKLSAYLYSTFKLIDQNPFFFFNSPLLLSCGAVQTKGSHLLWYFFGVDTPEWHWTVQLHSFLTRHCLRTSFTMVGNHCHIPAAMKQQWVTMSAQMSSKAIAEVTNTSQQTVDQVLRLSHLTGSVVRSRRWESRHANAQIASPEWSMRVLMLPVNSCWHDPK